jgi:hypothetical protein
VLVVAAFDCVDLKLTVLDACLDEELEALDDLELERLVLLDVDLGKEAEALNDVELCWLVGVGVELDNFGLLLEELVVVDLDVHVTPVIVAEWVLALVEELEVEDHTAFELDEHWPVIEGTASIPEPIATRCCPQLAAFAIRMLLFP